MALTDDFMSLFEGLKRAHGTYDIEGAGQRDSDGKVKGRAATLMEPVTRDLWEQHLSGKRSLGIVPINDESTCCFGAIDVDIYNGLNPQSIAIRIRELGLPLVVTLTKSGGVHLYIFTTQFVQASLLRAKLSEMSAALGYGGSEIFPKQSKILSERGDAGSWINMPYFGGTRHAVDYSGNSLTAEEFVRVATSSKIDPGSLVKLKIEPGQVIQDGPPCLQHLLDQGFPSGTRNNGLYNLGVYLKKAFSDSWQHKIHEWNIKFMDPPLTSEEVAGVIKSLDRKEYKYTCSKPPIMPFCSSGVCKMRKFGIGSGDEEINFPKLHSLTKFNTKPPIWFLDVEGAGRLELTTEELQAQQKFQRKCMELLNMMPQNVNNLQWTQMVNDLMKNVIIIHVPEDSSTKGQFFSLVEQFCTGKAQARVDEEILLGKPYRDEEGRYYFRVGDLVKFLERQHFKEFKVHQITAMLKDRGAQHVTLKLKGKDVSCWAVKDIERFSGDFAIPKEITDAKPPY